jgi:hypothetical protein
VAAEKEMVRQMIEADLEEMDESKMCRKALRVYYKILVQQGLIKR